MQDRYVGDFGDFAKYSLLNAVSKGRRLGMAWYLFPDEGHNSDGKHISYLDKPEVWRTKDPELFDSLNSIIQKNQRNINAVRQRKILDAVAHSFEQLHFLSTSYKERAYWRKTWFNRQCLALGNCNLVFADPDNGLCLDNRFKYGSRLMWKRLPLSEAEALSHGRSAIFYHHNSRFKGGHLKEIDYWLERIPNGSFAVQVRYYSPRTFFFVNADPSIRQKAQDWVNNFGDKAELIVKTGRAG